MEGGGEQEPMDRAAAFWGTRVHSEHPDWSPRHNLKKSEISRRALTCDSPAVTILRMSGEAFPHR